ncbi:MAG: lipopolysaccharide assembly protein LapA domain-containing protein [Brevinema sp.]
MKLIIGIVAFFIFLVFAIQNIVPVDLRFFTFQIEQMPLFSVIITIFLLGVFCGYSMAWVRSIFLPKKSQKTPKD